jgi:putative ABC transport system permease protein
MLLNFETIGNIFKNYFKTSFRNLKRNKVYSFINISGLSMGLACAMLIMLPG